MNRASRRNFLPPPTFADFKRMMWGFADEDGRIYRIQKEKPTGWALFDSDRWSPNHRVAYVWRDGRPPLQSGQTISLANSEEIIQILVENTFPSRRKVESLIIVLQ